MSREQVARGVLVAVALGVVASLAMAGGALLLGASAANARALGAWCLIIYPSVAALAFFGGVMLGVRVTRS